MEISEVREMIETALPDSRVAVEGEGCSFSVIVVAPCFAALGPVQRQRLVLGAVQAPLTSGALHAIGIKAYTPQEWESVRAESTAQLVRLQ